MYSLLLTFGLAFIIQDVCRYIWGPNGLPLSVPDTIAAPISSDLFFITWYRIFMWRSSSSRSSGLFAFLRYTRVGVRIRAGTLDLETVVGAWRQRRGSCAASISASAVCLPAWRACWPADRSA